MIDIDSRVRDSLADRAADAPEGIDLLRTVHARSRRIGVRRRLVATGVAAVVAVLVAVPMLDRFAGDASTLRPAAPNQVRLVSGPAPATSFPLRVMWLPDGLQAPKLYRWRDQLSSLAVETDDGVGAFTITVSPTDLTRSKVASSEADNTRRRIMVGDKPGEIVGKVGMPDVMILVVQRAPGQWVHINRDNPPWTDTQLVEVAATLVDKPTTQRPVLGFAVVPEGYVTSKAAGGSVRLAPTADADENEQFATDLQLDVDGLTGSTGEQVAVGQRTGLLSSTGGRWRLDVMIQPTQRLRIEAPSAAIDRADFLRFAAGVTVPSGLRSAGG